MQALPPWLRGVFFLVACLVNTVFFFIFLIPSICFKPLTDRTPWSAQFAAFLMAVVAMWANGNTFLLNLIQKTKWDVELPSDLKPDLWYLLMCNHCSWADIFVLFKFFNDRIPFPKFFIKDELLWVPILGVTCWGLGFPIMRRYSKKYLKKHPDQEGRDLEATRLACERFKDQPITVVNFIEGSRYRPYKAKKQNSPYRHLLCPRAGGAGLVLYSMGHYLTAAIDVTLAYSKPNMTMWDFICGDVERVLVRARLVKIPQQFIQRDYRVDADFRESFQAWINQRWQEKDQIIEAFRSQENDSPAPQEKIQ